MLFLLWVYCVFDVIATDSFLARNLPKMAWLFLVIFLPAVGGVAWLALGRPINAGWRPGDTTVRQRRTVLGFEDSDSWSSQPRRPPPRRSDPAPTRHPASDPNSHEQPDGEAAHESPSARERRLMEWEAELKRREENLGPDGGESV